MGHPIVPVAAYGAVKRGAFDRSKRRLRGACAGLVGLCLMLLTVQPLDAQTTHARFPVTDGEVRALAISGRTLYVGGEFNVIGTPTGAGVAVDSATAARSAFAEVRGSVYAAVEDGAGGWFIGGAFDRVGDEARANLARIRADGSVDAWDPAADGPVHALARDGAVVYAGGAFSTVAGQPRVHLAALDPSGAAMPWSTSVDDVVRALIFENGVLYLGGDFTQVGGQSRKYLAALDGAGQVTTWTCDADARVHCLATADGVLYAGGEFLNVGGQWRHRIAALDLATGAVTPWNGTSNGTVRAIAVNRGKVFAGGFFTMIGGRPRNGIAALSTRWWQAVDWDPNPNGAVTSLMTIQNRVYAGGDFTRIGGLTRIRTAVIDTASGRVEGWTPPANGRVNVLALSGTRIYLGGEFTSVGGQVRRGAAAIDRVSEQVTSWDPRVEGVVRVIAPKGNRIYVGGWFTYVAGEAHLGVAAVDSSSGALHPWTVAADCRDISAITASDAYVYLGFDSYPYDRLRAFSATTGGLQWSRYCGVGTNRTWSLAIVNDHLYYGGRDSTSHSGLLMLAPETGQVLRSYPTGVVPDAPYYVYSMTAGAGDLWVHGQRLFRVDPALGDFTELGPSNYDVMCMTTAGARVYEGGFFSAIGGYARDNLVALDTSTLEVTNWNPGANGWVRALAASDGVVYAGGRFTSVGSASHRYLAAIDDVGQIVAVPPDCCARSPIRFVVTPNPLNSSTTIHFSLSAPARTSLELFDVTGRSLRSIVRARTLSSGDHRIPIDRQDLPAGVYWLRLRVDGRASTRKIVVAS